MPWEANTEKLRCLMVLNDNAAERLSSRAGPAFFRAFVVEDRATGEMAMKFRWRYRDPDERNWFRVCSPKRGSEAVDDFLLVINQVLRESALAIGQTLREGDIKAFYPPDDAGDAAATIIWLEMNDLIEVSVVETA